MEQYTRCLRLRTYLINHHQGLTTIYVSMGRKVTRPSNKLTEECDKLASGCYDHDFVKISTNILNYIYVENYSDFEIMEEVFLGSDVTHHHKLVNAVKELTEVINTLAKQK
jgi:hypothetical protein